METVDFEVNEMYSKLFSWFIDNFGSILLISEAEDIVSFVTRYGDNVENTLQMFRYEYEIIMTSEQLQELKALIKSVKE